MRKVVLLIVMVIISFTAFAKDCSDYSAMLSSYRRLSNHFNYQSDVYNNQVFKYQNKIAPKVPLLILDHMCGVLDRRSASDLQTELSLSLTNAEMTRELISEIRDELVELIQTEFEATDSCSAFSKDLAINFIDPMIINAEETIDHYNIIISYIRDDLNSLTELQ